MAQSVYGIVKKDIESLLAPEVSMQEETLRILITLIVNIPGILMILYLSHRYNLLISNNPILR